MTIDRTGPVSRAERQARTRERLIKVARGMFLADGYSATSLDKVALEAGFSKGAVYSNFAGKEQLCLAVLDNIQEEQIAGVLGAFAADTDLDGRIDAFVEWARKELGEPRWTALEVEFAAAARQSPYVAEELVKRRQDVVEALARLISALVEQENLELAMSPEQAATALLSLGIGLGVMRSLDHSIDVDVFGEVIRGLLRPARR